MPDAPSGRVAILINGQSASVGPGTTVAAALLMHGTPSRISITGEPRTALCGMGVCFECRAVIDGIPHQRSCQIVCRNGMVVETQS